MPIENAKKDHLITFVRIRNEYMKRERVRLQAEIDELIGRADQTDEEEDQRYGAGSDGASGGASARVG